MTSSTFHKTPKDVEILRTKQVCNLGGINQVKSWFKPYGCKVCDVLIKKFSHLQIWRKIIKIWRDSQVFIYFVQNGDVQGKDFCQKNLICDCLA